MNIDLDTGQWVVIGICAILILGYILGYYSNRQRAGKVLAWLHKGLKTFGTVTAGEKLPGMATGGRLEVNQASAPFRRVEAVYLLAPRENPFFWIFHLLRGKSDELILWFTYQSKPAQNIEVARRGDRQFESRLKDRDKAPLTVSDGPRGLLIASEPKKSDSLVDQVRSLLEGYGSIVYRLALRENKPHLFLRVNLRLIQSASAEEFFSALRELTK